MLPDGPVAWGEATWWSVFLPFGERSRSREEVQESDGGLQGAC